MGLRTLDISGVDLSWDLDFCSSQARYMLLAALQCIERATSGELQMPGSREMWRCRSPNEVWWGSDSADKAHIERVKCEKEGRATSQGHKREESHRN